MMQFTGERYVPTLNGQIKYEHWHRYALACDFVGNKSVLDIACGEGFGSNLLARHAKSVVGVDIDSACIKHAKHTYHRSNLKFLEGGCDAIPLPNNSVDIVVSFETIEHHNKHEEMMREIKRVLVSDGYLIISSPSRYEYSERVNFTNEFHVKELYYDEFLSLLESYFSKTTIFGQKISIGSFIFPIYETVTKSVKPYSGSAKGVEESLEVPGNPIYYIAFCSDHAIGELKSSLFFDKSDDILAALHEDRRLAFQRLQEYSQQISTSKELSRELENCKNELSDARQSIEALRRCMIDAEDRMWQERESARWLVTSRMGRLGASLRRLEPRIQLLSRKILLRRSPFHHALDFPKENVIFGERVTVAGWIFSDAGCITWLDAFLDGHFLGTLRYGVERPDVAIAFSSGSSACGFEANFFVPSFLVDGRNGKKLVIRAFDQKGNRTFIQKNVNIQAQFGYTEKVKSLLGDVQGAVKFSLLNGRTDDNLPAPRQLWLNTTFNPKISIVIPVFNKSQYTFACLESLQRELDRASCPITEIIVVDDASIDDTAEVLGNITGIRILRNSQNLGFVKSCNFGASEAKGEYLVFLNNDTLVQPKCFELLLETFQSFPQAGLVGAKLIYPDGRLQEAGGIVWQDGSAWNYGRLDDPNKPEYSYARTVDYCSGACFMISTALFKQLNGFDEYYTPAYYEDTDLAFRVRQAGNQVIFQPLSKIIHFEGVTSGQDIQLGVKSYQVVNQKKFFERWESVLSAHAPNGINVVHERDRTVSLRILVIDACVLTPDQDAGSQNVYNHIQVFRSLGFKVTFAPDNLQYHEHYTGNLQRMGVECLYFPYTSSIKSHLEENGDLYNCIFIARFNIALKHLLNIRTFCPNAKVIFNTEDLHHLREMRQSEVDKNTEMARLALIHKEQELGVVKQADYTLVVSDFEKEILAQECPNSSVEVIPMSREIYGCRADFEQRSDILFIGGFRHTPNIDGVIYFVSQIFPHVKNALPDVQLYVLGSKPPSEIRKLASKDVIVTGYLPDVSAYFDRCRLSVAPLRYGAGVKGKLLTSFCYGLPAVATPSACEGMGLTHEQDVLIGKSPNEFANYIITLYTDRNLWERLSANGLSLVRKRYSSEAASRIFRRIFADLSINLSQ